MQEREKKFIHSIQTINGLAVSETEKHQVVFNHFLSHTGIYFLDNGL
jgi:hypothetical protein